MNIPNDQYRFRKGVTLAFLAVLILIIFAVTVGFYEPAISYLGLKPRTVEGLAGIITSPILHGDVVHLISNSIPLLLAIPVLFYFYYKDAIAVILVVYFLSGFWVWISARDAVHLGASGVVNGILSFLFFAGIFQKNRAGFAMALAILFLYGTPILAGFFPTPGISFEAHISGALAGLFMASFLSWNKRKEKKIQDSVEDVINTTAEDEITFNYEYKRNSSSEK